MSLLTSQHAIQRYPIVWKAAAITGQLRRQGSRRLLDGVNATKVGLKASATSFSRFSRWARAVAQDIPTSGLRSTPIPTPVLVHVRAQPSVVVDVRATDVAVYQPGELQLYEAPAQP